jgi:hypothetical protein
MANRQFQPSRPDSGFGRPGWVYILTNLAMPGLVKIGLTTRDPTTRIAELTNAIGVPVPFVLAWCRAVADCGLVEETVHRMMKDRRENEGREFFRCDPATARQVIEAAASGQLGRKYRVRKPVQRKGGYRSRWRQPPDYTPLLLTAGALVVAVVWWVKPAPPAWCPDWLAFPVLKVEGRA